MTLRERHPGVASAIAAALILAACSPGETPAPAFALERCERVALTDAETGREIVGAEDLDIDRAGARLFVSAYDRRAVEGALKSGSDTVPEGGLYSVRIADLAVGANEIQASPLVDRRAVDGGLRPHGIAFDASTGEVSFVNRGYVKEGRRWRLETQILTLSSTGEVSAAHQIDCSANDIASLDGRSIVTLDHGSCGWRAAVEDFFGLKKARVVDEKSEMVAANLGFANGVAAPAGDRIFVAATRERALYPIDFVEGRATIDKAIPIGAAPDNLTLSDEGAIVAAVHPSLLAIGLQRRLGVGRSPSRIVEIDPANGDQMRLFDDPKGSVIAAATAAISTRGLLIIGSVMDPGIVVCRGAM